MKKYDNRIKKLKIEIEELELKIAKAISCNKPAFAKRLEIMRERKVMKLERWIRI
tara:strand:+ start:849 stop:1013 length:165 start_codon:yes stop_codon:yes gene_type:complete